MFLLWSFAALLLGSVRGFPVSNNTGNSTSNEDDFYASVDVNFTNPALFWDCTNSSCNYTTRAIPHGPVSSPDAVRERSPYVACFFLPTCYVHTLDKTLQVGDEKAGKATSDPYAPGKK